MYILTQLLHSKYQNFLHNKTIIQKKKNRKESIIEEETREARHEKDDSFEKRERKICRIEQFFLIQIPILRHTFSYTHSNVFMQDPIYHWKGFGYRMAEAALYSAKQSLIREFIDGPNH